MDCETEISYSVVNLQSKPQGSEKENGDLAPLVNEASNTPSTSENKSNKEAAKILKSETPTSSVKEMTKKSSIAKDMCAMYKKRQVVRWSLLSSKEQLDSLVDSLNSRGVRERVLRENIQQKYNNLVRAIEKCPLKEENQVQKREGKQRGRRGRQQQQGVDKSRYKAMEEFIEANLRDQILDLEDRIWQGGLGGPKVGDRPAWRKKIENGIYDHLSKNGADAEAAKSDKDGGSVIVNGDTDVEQVAGASEEASGAAVDSAEASSCGKLSTEPVVNGDVERMDVDSDAGV